MFLAISCQGGLDMALNELVVHPTKLSWFDVLLPLFDLNFRPTYVESLTALIKICPNMRCNCLTPVPLYAIQILPCRLIRRIVNACPSYPLSFLVALMYTVDNIIYIAGLGGSEVSRFR